MPVEYSNKLFGPHTSRSIPEGLHLECCFGNGRSAFLWTRQHIARPQKQLSATYSLPHPLERYFRDWLDRSHPNLVGAGDEAAML